VSQELEAADPAAQAVPAEVRDFLRRRFLASPDEALLEMGDALVSAPDRVAELRRTAIPSFVLHGDGDDAWPPAEQRDMASRLGARYLELAGVGHSPAVDDPAATVTALTSFWASVDQAGAGGSVEHVVHG
jgi:pimeloyl-ACP methyl ester carboxylesterase